MKKHLNFIALFVSAACLTVAASWRLAVQRAYGPEARSAWRMANDELRDDDREALLNELPPGWVWRSYFHDELSCGALGMMRKIAVAFPEYAKEFRPKD